MEKDGELYLLCRSERRAEKDAAIRRQYTERMEQALEKLARGLAERRLRSRERIHEAVGCLRERYPQVARFYSIDVVEENYTLRLVWSLPEESAAECAALNGTSLLRTNRVDWSTAAVWKTYMRLTPRTDRIPPCTMHSARA